VLRREPTSRSTEVSKELPEFHYDLPQTGCVCTPPKQDFVDTLYMHYAPLTLTLKYSSFCPEKVFSMFRMILAINSDYFRR
jgi:hypothetical protein